MFKRASDSSWLELEDRVKGPRKTMRFGVDFLDDALRGIFPDDLILLGAPSGLGKTQLCCNIAYANLEEGRRVHYVALEASQYEIERRLKYPLVMERFLADPNRPSLGKKLTYPDWLMGESSKELEPYEKDAATFFDAAFKNLSIYYKQEKFGVHELIQSVLWAAADTDLILIDHVHYFDLDDDNENRAIREIAKTVRSLALEQQVPILLVAHLRKRDRANDELVAGLDEFHGSSDLYKIATKVITLAPGRMTESGQFETFFRIPKNRIDGGVTRFLGRQLFNPKRGGYENGYQLGWANTVRKDGFTAIQTSYYPDWARASEPARVLGNSNDGAPRKPRGIKDQGRQTGFQGL
jgi:KaiC/GvpD/RAD55 family RecA-like ATPase